MTTTHDVWPLIQDALDRGQRPLDDEVLLDQLAQQLDEPGLAHQLDELLALERLTTLLQAAPQAPAGQPVSRRQARRKPLAAATAAALLVVVAIGTWKRSPITPGEDQLARVAEPSKSRPPSATRPPSRVAIRSLEITIERDLSASPFAPKGHAIKTTHSTLTPR